MKRVLAAMLFCSAIASPCRAQTTPQTGPTPQANTMQEVLSGNVVPLTISLRDMREGWRRMSASAPDQNGLMQLFTADMGGYQPDAYYTRGHTLTLGTDTFLVGYRFAAREIDPNQRRYDTRRFPALPTGLSPETKLELSLLNTRLVSALNNVRPFDFQQELDASNERVAAAQKMRTEAVNAASLQNLQTIGAHLNQYTAEKSKMPPLKDLAATEAALERWGHGQSPFQHPDTKEPYKANTALAEKPLKQIAKPDRAIVFYEASTAPDGTRGVVFANGRARRIPEAEWAQLLKASTPIPPPKPKVAAPKTATLSGAAALYYMFQMPQQDQPGASRYYISKNGRVYYRDPKTKEAIWVVPPTQPIKIGVQEAAPYREYQGYNGSKTRRAFGGYGPVEIVP